MSIQALSLSLDRTQLSHDSQYDSKIAPTATSPVNAWADPSQSSFVGSPALLTCTSSTDDCVVTKKIDYRTFQFDMYVHEYPWLYFLF